MSKPEWLESLNPEQRQAVEATDGPLLVLSGAGTGKTRVLTSKIAWLLHQKLAKPWEILAVTFTNKAAGEMKSRVRNLVGEEADSLWIGTFHSIGLRILKQHAPFAGRDPGFVILDEDDQQKIVRQIIVEELKLDPKFLSSAQVVEAIARQKDKGYYEGAPDVVPDFGDTELKIYKSYQGRLATLNGVDFADLLLLPLKVFREHPEVLEEYQKKFKYILVDEYQDTNAVQYKLLKLLSGMHHNIACVGDDDQSIYSWRGAEINNILQFERDFEGAKIVRLETNYRSTPHILSAASGLIANNKGRLGKTLRPCEKLSGEKALRVKVYAVQSGMDEAATVAGHIQNERSKGTPYEQMAILVRSGYQTRLFEDRLMHRGIPYRIVGGVKFYERQEIRDIIAYLRLIVYPHDDLSFERAIGVPRRGLGDKALDLIREISRSKKIPMLEAALLAAKKLKGRQAAALETFCNQIARWRALNNKGEISHYEFVRVVLSESGYAEMWRNSKKEEGEARLQNIQEFLGMLKNDYKSIAEFLEYLTLFATANEDVGELDSVSLMTMHAAKGLEFEVVFLPSWEMGVFPNERSMRDASGGGLEEERRLAYVSITRAKRRIEIYVAASRQVFGTWQRSVQSIFLDEIPRECVDVGEF